jgi:hypothetical protein
VTERPVRPTRRVRVTWFVVPAPGTVGIDRMPPGGPTGVFRLRRRHGTTLGGSAEL